MCVALLLHSKKPVGPNVPIKWKQGKELACFGRKSQEGKGQKEKGPHDPRQQGEKVMGGVK